MNYLDEALRRLMGIEQVEIPLPLEVIPQPGPYKVMIPTNQPHMSLMMDVEFARDRVSLLLRDHQGSPLWIRYFNFTHPEIPPEWHQKPGGGI